MVRNRYRYSLDRRDAKIAGVCAAVGDKLGIDPTFVRVGFVAVPLLTPMTFVQALIIYAVVGVIMAVQNGGTKSRTKDSEFDQMDLFSRRPSVHAMRTELDETDRRRMAIDHHLSKQNDELAREIEALREDK
ncbi:PspC domain-containing protein [Sphingomonas piscis]|uniref:PspC domain-containing protein n=1 Tax=Sphingomonas piscis TaxID=2714943 RepID=A0A6G7YR20_9SPHN|nr:PspC domain-containing protein [Sphingomonas piscis]QIK79183.1 PspC domain-containing protein [Sphingomonas piscis]